MRLNLLGIFSSIKIEVFESNCHNEKLFVGIFSSSDIVNVNKSCAVLSYSLSFAGRKQQSTTGQSPPQNVRMRRLQHEIFKRCQHETAQNATHRC